MMAKKSKQQSRPFKIIKHSYFWVGISLLVAITSIFFFFLNSRLSIEFTWGIELSIEKTEQEADLQQSLQDAIIQAWFEQPQVNINQQDETTELLVALPFEDDDQVKEVSSLINTTLIDQDFITSENDIIGSSLNGPSVSGYMKNSAIQAIVIGLIIISIYIMFSFAWVRKHISPLTLWGVTIASMLFATIVAAGSYGVWMMFNDVISIDTIFIISALTIMWYSINDTIIVLDRVRENIAKYNKDLESGNKLYGQLIEDSIWQTMRRSLATGFTTILVAITMMIFGTDLLQKFAFVVGFGVLAGMFSSLFFATPLTYLLLKGKYKKEHKRL